MTNPDPLTPATNPVKMAPMAVVIWTEEAIIEAIQEWTAEHGRPPAMREWRSGVPGFPTAVTVRSRFGTFDAARRAAGVVFLRANQAGEWTRQDILDAIFRWRFEHGELPRSQEWAVSVDGFPTEWWVRKYFGTWNAAIVAAGYEPRFPRRSKRGYRAITAHVTKRDQVAA